MKKLYEFYWDCCYGKISGLFVEDEQVVKEAIGKEASFGEVLGKHSEVYGELKEEDFETILENPEDIKTVESFGFLPFGYNPLDYVTEDECLGEPK